MKLRHIEVFHAVYLTGSASGAARALNVSQPSISKIIRYAEDQLGFKLFDRTKGRLIPTEKAVKLFAEIEPVFEKVNALKAFATKLASTKKGRLRFAMTPAFASADGLSLLAGVADGTLSSLVDVAGANSRIKQNAHPKWRGTASVTWRNDNWGAGAFYKYVGDVVDTGVKNADGDLLPVGSFKTLNLYGDYTFDELLGGDLRVRLGVRNVGDVKPPVADEFGRGYFSGLHSNRGRYWYSSVRKTF